VQLHSKFPSSGNPSTFRSIVWDPQNPIYSIYIPLYLDQWASRHKICKNLWLMLGNWTLHVAQLVRTLTATELPYRCIFRKCSAFHHFHAKHIKAAAIDSKHFNMFWSGTNTFVVLSKLWYYLSLLRYNYSNLRVIFMMNSFAHEIYSIYGFRWHM
jgi:hypothetical protein